MSIPSPSDSPVEGQRLPESVSRIAVGDKEIYLVGTAHVSKESVADVATTIRTVAPDAVCVELCQARFANLTDPESWKKLNITQVLRQGKAMLLLSSLIMTSFQRRIGKKLGVMPGAEMLEAVERAKELDIPLVLADRDIQITLKRTWSQLGFWSKLKMLGQLMMGLFVVEEISAETVEELKQKEHLGDLLQAMAETFPNLKETLIDERDTYLAQKIREAKGQRIVAAVGAGHVAGIAENIGHQHDVSRLEVVPPQSLWPRVLKWSVPAAIIALLVYGFFVGGAEQSRQSIYLWILINGTLSALGAVLALGHPLTVASAFLAAPLTSLNPMIAAGWVAGLVQAWVKKPTVEDLEGLPEAITTFRGFWTNAVSRILLVVALANLGSMLGTFIAGSWIAVRAL